MTRRLAVAAVALVCAAAGIYLGCLLVVWVALAPLRAAARLLGGA
ncbi:hypothetical protein [Cellulomonas sp.]|nr:hypothetical protein [Cellulomonas sp.]